MSWAGKKSVREFFRSLFHRGQASSSASAVHRQVIPLSREDYQNVEKCVNAWVKGKGYRLPDQTLHDTAARIGLDPSLLHRYFVMQDTDFRTWRAHLRLQDAMQQMIAEPQSTVSAIALRVGITDRSNFCRQFKAFTGTTPAEWRKNQK